MKKLLLLILSLNAFIIGFAAESSDLKVINTNVALSRETNDLNSKEPSSKKSSNDNLPKENKSRLDQAQPIHTLEKNTSKDHTIASEKPSSINRDAATKHKNTSEQVPPSYNGPHMREKESEFVNTGFTILIAISLLFMAFVAFKTYRRKSRNAKIKKYGIKLTRGNIEMTPLPLDNDDDDETIFDLKNVPT